MLKRALTHSSLWCLGLMLAGLLLGGHGAWLKAKAQVAQLLLDQAWHKQRQGDTDARPWPWADTRALARLTVDKLGVDEILLEGASGSTLAFGPGHLSGSAPPGASGHTIISGHRDTHFAFLGQLQRGDELWIEAADGRKLRYRVRSLEVRDSRHQPLIGRDGNWLTLVTCYPFDALTPGGPLRFLVHAELAGIVSRKT